MEPTDKRVPTVEQWEALAGVIESKGIKTLTKADYNYPTDNPSRVATWLLKDGIYSTAQGVDVVPDNASSPNATLKMFIKYTSPASRNKAIMVYTTTELEASQEYNGVYKWRYWVAYSDNGDRFSYGALSPNVTQSAGTSTTDVMSQKATTEMVFADPSSRHQVQVGYGATATGGNNSVAIGPYATILASGGVAIGGGPNGAGAPEAAGLGSVALGAGAKAKSAGEVNIGSTYNTNYGYDNTNYRLLTGLHDPQSEHDAATKGYVDTAVASAGGATTIDTTDWESLWS